jgi:hypothetical protein
VYSLKDHIRRNLSLILLVTLLLVLPSCRYIRQRLPFGRPSLNEAFEWAKKDSARIADSLKRVMSDKNAFNRTLTDSLMSIEDKDLPEGATAPRFYIITGSFTNHENAIQTAGQYSAKGYTTTVIGSTNSDGSRLELVSVKTFSDYNKASVFIKEFKAKIDPHAWIYAGK